MAKEEKKEDSPVRVELKRIYAVEKVQRPEVYEIQGKDAELARHLAKTDEDIAKILGK